MQILFKDLKNFAFQRVFFWIYNEYISPSESGYVFMYSQEVFHLHEQSSMCASHNK